MGRPRKPTILKVLSGTARPHRLNKHEPQVKALHHPPCPEHLPETHKRWWDYIASHAAHLRCVTEADIPALEEMVGVKVEIEKLVTTRKSSVKCRKILFDMLGKFGMTPSERSKVSGIPDEERSPEDEFAVNRG